jgi:hypothetical protein
MNTSPITNYMIPAAGTPHAVIYDQIFSATPFAIDWKQFMVDNFPFQPQGVFIDNTNGASPIVINIQPIDFNVTCPAGATKQAQFPAPTGQTMTITGNGQASIIFVDFPVLPSDGSTGIVGNVTVVNATGGNLVTTLQPAVASALAGSITGVAVTVSLAPAANTNLRKLTISLTENATLAVAGLDLLTVTLNGVQVFKKNIFIPAVAVSGLGGVEIAALDFDAFAQNAGAAGTLVATLGTALATGSLDVNAWFA